MLRNIVIVVVAITVIIVVPSCIIYLALLCGHGPELEGLDLVTASVVINIVGVIGGNFILLILVWIWKIHKGCCTQLDRIENEAADRHKRCDVRLDRIENMLRELTGSRGTPDAGKGS